MLLDMLDHKNVLKAEGVLRDTPISGKDAPGTSCVIGVANIQ
jgi:hypothetical protein